MNSVVHPTNDQIAIDEQRAGLDEAPWRRRRSKLVAAILAGLAAVVTAAAIAAGGNDSPGTPEEPFIPFVTSGTPSVIVDPGSADG